MEKFDQYGRRDEESQANYRDGMNAGVPEKVWQLRKAFEVHAGKKPLILSIGSGTGRTEKEILSITGGRAIGVDLSLNMLETVNGEEENPTGELWLVQANGLELPLPNRSVDVALLCSMTHEFVSLHDKNPYQVEVAIPLLSEALSKLKIGGRLGFRDFVVPEDFPQWCWIELGRRRWRQMDPTEFVSRFASDFKGRDLGYLSNQVEIWKKRNMWRRGARVLVGREDLTDVLAHYSWARTDSAYQAEVEEKYAYLTVGGWQSLIERAALVAGLEINVLEAKAWQQPGYGEHLQERLNLYDLADKKLGYPAMTGTVIAERRA